MFFKDPLTLLVGMHFCAVLWSFKKTAEQTGLPQWGEGPPGSSLLHPAWLLLERDGWSTLGAGETQSLCRLALEVFLNQSINQLMNLAAPGLGCSMWIFRCSMQTLSCGMWDLAPSPGIEPRPRALGVPSFSHCTTREVPGVS